MLPPGRPFQPPERLAHTNTLETRSGPRASAQPGCKLVKPRSDRTLAFCVAEFRRLAAVLLAPVLSQPNHRGSSPCPLVAPANLKPWRALRASRRVGVRPEAAAREQASQPASQPATPGAGAGANGRGRGKASAPFIPGPNPPQALRPSRWVVVKEMRFDFS